MPFFAWMLLGLIAGFWAVQHRKNILRQLEMLDDALINLINRAGTAQLSQRGDERIHQLLKCGNFGHSIVRPPVIVQVNPIFQDTRHHGLKTGESYYQRADDHLVLAFSTNVCAMW